MLAELEESSGPTFASVFGNDAQQCAAIAFVGRAFEEARDVRVIFGRARARGAKERGNDAQVGVVEEFGIELVEVGVLAESADCSQP